MSINSAMLSGVSGLIANSAALGAISDNIANVNTVGYKENSTQFEDLVTAKATAGNYNSGGVQAQVSQLISAQGQFQQTTNSTDMGINGNGMFVVADSSAGITATDGPSFTRAGEFTSDKAGYLVNSAGLYLQGWVANTGGRDLHRPFRSLQAFRRLTSIRSPTRQIRPPPRPSAPILTPPSIRRVRRPRRFSPTAMIPPRPRPLWPLMTKGSRRREPSRTIQPS